MASIFGLIDKVGQQSNCNISLLSCIYAFRSKNWEKSHGLWKREHSDDDIYLAIIYYNRSLKFLELNSNFCTPVKVSQYQKLAWIIFISCKKLCKIEFLFYQPNSVVNLQAGKIWIFYPLYWDPCLLILTRNFQNI